MLVNGLVMKVEGPYFLRSGESNGKKWSHFGGAITIMLESGKIIKYLTKSVFEEQKGSINIILDKVKENDYAELLVEEITKNDKVYQDLIAARKLEEPKTKETLIQQVSKSKSTDKKLNEISEKIVTDREKIIYFQVAMKCAATVCPKSTDSIKILENMKTLTDNLYSMLILKAKE